MLINVNEPSEATVRVLVSLSKKWYTYTSMTDSTRAQVSNTYQEEVSPAMRFLSNLKRYVADGQKADVLYQHQKNIFDDTARFLEAGEKRGYIDAPTGTGKTVLFVSLAEAFSYQDVAPPKILVVTPTKDLVRQTLGGTRGDKGFAGFAPNLKVGTFYSDTPAKQRHLEEQITITTYASLGKLAAMRKIIHETDGSRTATLVNQVNDLYDIIFLDEGHKALGESSRQIINELDNDKIIIGFTATPEYTASRSLEQLLPHMIHRLDLKEAITMKMLSPVVPLAIPAPKTAAHEFTLGASGEYETRSLKQLIYSAPRNHMIVDLASNFISDGHTPIIACIPGDNMIHPHMIAEQLSTQSVTGADGEKRFIRACAVTGAMSAASRQKIYAQLETGEIDALAYIDVLTEGWDSQRANIIINARPTRSLVAARQRMGRILRVKPDDRPAVALDIVDTISSATAPQVSMADIFSQEELKSGTPIGEITPVFRTPLTTITQRVASTYGDYGTVRNLYSQYMLVLETLPKVVRGQAQIKQDGRVRTFATADRLFKRFDVDRFMLRYLKQQGIETRDVRSTYQSIPAYAEDQIEELIAKLPDGARQGRGVTVNGHKYVNLTDLLGIIQQKCHQPNLAYSTLEKATRQIATKPQDIYLTRYFRARTHRGIALYSARTMVEVSVAQQIVTHISQLFQSES
jgi:superfamily II DNA or RNA helicase